MEKILKAMQEAERKAWDSLAGYKFLMFGYHAAAWVNYNKLLDQKEPNPFRRLVKSARDEKKQKDEDGRQPELFTTKKEG